MRSVTTSRVCALEPRLCCGVTPIQHPVVSAFSRSRYRNFKNHRSPLAANLLAPAAPAESHRCAEAWGYKLSTDPFFVEKVTGIVGLYLNPPENAVVLCVDEKTQIQALDRTQPLLPMGLGYVEGVTHDYIRHGTTTLCKPRHRHQEFLSFLRRIDKEVPKELDLHLIVDNFCTHKHSKEKDWLAQRPRFHVHYTPTYASWLNQEERWYGLITQKAIRRESFSNVKELISKIEQFVAAYGKTKVPFKWTATADSILKKFQRLFSQISGASH